MKDLVFKKRHAKCNTNGISMKASLSIKIGKPENYKKAHFWTH